MKRSKINEFKSIESALENIIEQISKSKKLYKNLLSQIESKHQYSATNLVHYLTLRSFDLRELQEKLNETGLPDLSGIESHVLSSLLSTQNLLSLLIGKSSILTAQNTLSVQQSNKLIQKNSEILFGPKPKKRNTRIMVTLPINASTDKELVKKLVINGMNVARINCAQYTEEVRKQMVENVREANRLYHKNCKIVMDLGGPKLRTGPIKQNDKWLSIKVNEDAKNNPSLNTTLLFHPIKTIPPKGIYSHTIPIETSDFQIGSIAPPVNEIIINHRTFRITLPITGINKYGVTAVANKAFQIPEDSDFSIRGRNEIHTWKISPQLKNEAFITLKKGDKLLLHDSTIEGNSALFNAKGKITKIAHIGCTIPEVLEYAEPGNPVFFNDGKIEGIVKKKTEEGVVVQITETKISGSKLKENKGINFPQNKYKLKGLTIKDKEDLESVVQMADMVNLSFVQDSNDVNELILYLQKKKSTIGILLKIETQEGFKNLPEIILEAMKWPSIGIMIARGDLAIETGWKNFVTLQQEIMRVCQSAHIPVIWATQVLENLIKKGTPTRSEITDAALSQNAECVMLNKGDYILKGIKMIDKILKRMEYFQQKQKNILPKLDDLHNFQLSHKAYDV